jgi:hypothetical protein
LVKKQPTPGVTLIGVSFSIVEFNSILFDIVVNGTFVNTLKRFRIEFVER